MCTGALRFSRLPCTAFHIIAQGTCWIQVEGQKMPFRLHEGEVLVLPGGQNHVMADTLAAPLCADIRLDEQDGLFVKIIRAWLTEPANQSIGWPRALSHPQLGAALGQIHAASKAFSRQMRVSPARYRRNARQGV